MRVSHIGEESFPSEVLISQPLQHACFEEEGNELQNRHGKSVVGDVIPKEVSQVGAEHG